jgi:signal peptidase II
MNLSRKLRLACLTCVLVCTIGCDQASKHLARSVLASADPVILPGGLVELRLAENPGSFLSLGALLPEPIRFAVFTLVVGGGLLALIAYLTSHARMGMLRFAGLSLVISGGIGNLLDRIFRHGLVTDFAIIRIGPVHSGIFNIADTLILLGMGIIFFTLRKQTAPDGPMRGSSEPPTHSVV